MDPSCDNEWDNSKRSRNNGEGSIQAQLCYMWGLINSMFIFVSIQNVLIIS